MKWQEVKSNWPTVSEKFHEHWAALTTNDIKAIAGKRDELVKRLQKRYSMERKKAEEEAETFVKTLN